MIVRRPRRAARGATALIPALVLSLASGARTPALAARPLVGASSRAADSVVTFHLRDQFGRMYDAAEYRGRTLVLVGASSGGRAAATAWVEALRRLQDDSTGAVVALPVLAVADLRKVPWLLRRFVRGQFPDERGHGVLLDWDGSLARRFKLDADRCTILTIAPSGMLHARTTTGAESVDTVAARTILRAAADLSATAVPASSR